MADELEVKVEDAEVKVEDEGVNVDVERADVVSLVVEDVSSTETRRLIPFGTVVDEVELDNVQVKVADVELVQGVVSNDVRDVCTTVQDDQTTFKAEANGTALQDGNGRGVHVKSSGDGIMESHETRKGKSVRKMNIRSGAEQRQYFCDDCDYKAGHPSNLKRHQMVHTGEKPHACDFCGYRAAESSKLTIHLRIHTGEKPFICDTCDYRAAQAAHLKIHKRIHTGEKSYACDMCEYRTTQSSRLTIHLRSHTGEKPYACEICEYRAVRADRIKMHKMTHKGESSYTCGKCTFTTSTLRTLKTHIKRNHTG